MTIIGSAGMDQVRIVALDNGLDEITPNAAPDTYVFMDSQIPVIFIGIHSSYIFIDINRCP